MEELELLYQDLQTAELISKDITFDRFQYGLKQPEFREKFFNEMKELKVFDESVDLETFSQRTGLTPKPKGFTQYLSDATEYATAKLASLWHSGNDASVVDNFNADVEDFLNLPDERIDEMVAAIKRQNEYNQRMADVGEIGGENNFLLEGIEWFGDLSLDVIGSMMSLVSNTINEPGRNLGVISGATATGVAGGAAAGAISGPGSAFTAAGGGLIGFKQGVGAAQSFASADIEASRHFFDKITEYGYENGIDIESREGLRQIISDKEFLTKTLADSATRGTVVAATEAVGNQIAPGFGRATSRVIKPLVKSKVSNKVLRETGASLVEGAAGGAGEALGSLAIGDEIDWDGVLTEAAAEILPGGAVRAINTQADRIVNRQANKTRQSILTAAVAGDRESFSSGIDAALELGTINEDQAAILKNNADIYFDMANAAPQDLFSNVSDRKEFIELSVERLTIDDEITALNDRLFGVADPLKPKIQADIDKLEKAKGKIDKSLKGLSGDTTIADAASSERANKIHELRSRTVIAANQLEVPITRADVQVYANEDGTYGIDIQGKNAKPAIYDIINDPLLRKPIVDVPIDTTPDTSVDAELGDLLFGGTDVGPEADTTPPQPSRSQRTPDVETVVAEPESIDPVVVSEVARKSREGETLTQAEQDVFDTLSDFERSTDRQALHGQRVNYLGEEGVLRVNKDGVTFEGRTIDSALNQDLTNAELGISEIAPEVVADVPVAETATDTATQPTLQPGDTIREFGQDFTVVNPRYDSQGNIRDVVVENAAGERRRLTSNKALSNFPQTIERDTASTDTEVSTTEDVETVVPTEQQLNDMSAKDRAEYELELKREELSNLETDLNAAAELIDGEINTNPAFENIQNGFTRPFDDGISEGTTPVGRKANASAVAKSLLDGRISNKIRGILGADFIADTQAKARRWRELSKELTPTQLRKTRTQALADARNEAIDNLLEKQFPGHKAQTAMVTEQAETVAKALPDTPIVLLRTPEEFRAKARELGVKLGKNDIVPGMYDPKTDTIYINVYHALPTTVRHEAAHAVFHRLFKGRSQDALALHKGIQEVLRNGTAAEKLLADRLQTFINQYNNNPDLRAEEFFSELVAFLAEKKSKIRKPRVEAIKQKINEILQSFIGMTLFDESSTINDVIDLVNNIAGGLASGKDIYEIIGENPSLNKINPNIRFQIIGEVGAANLQNAVTVMENLQVAKEMTTAGKDAKTIRLATGWEIGGDGKWRLEIPDVDIVGDTLPFTDSFRSDDYNISLEDFVDGDLLDVYPQLRREVFVIRDMYFNGGNAAVERAYGDWNIYLAHNLFDVLNFEDAKSLILHEIQHIVQDIEGFSRGANIESSLNDVNVYKDIAKDTYGENSVKYKEIAKSLDERDEGISAWEAYNRSAGEVEARNVQTRMNMSMQERANTLLSETEDVAQSDQIYIQSQINPNIRFQNLESSNNINNFAENTNNERYRNRTRWDERRGDQTLEGAPIVEGATGANPELTFWAEEYARRNNIPYKRQSKYVSVSPQRAKRIAEEYDKMEHNPSDPKVKEAYENLIQQTIAQYRMLEEAGYKFWFFDETNDPYDGNPWNAMRDLRNNKQMGSFATEAGFGSGATELNVEDNPMLADTGIKWGYGSVDGTPKRVLANDLFRAVHDAFGHGLEGAGFRARGEENAWQAHARLFTGSAVGAITSETRGQNSWLNYGKFGEQNRTAKVEDTVFADQKTGLMPEWTWKEGFDEGNTDIRLQKTDSTLTQAQNEVDNVTLKYNRQGQHLAPNGKPSNLTEEQAKIVRTPAFKKWFGDWETDPENASKVVDTNGEPLVVYHGTTNSFTVFDTNATNFKEVRGGSFFGDKTIASYFDDGGKGTIIPVFLNSKTPFINFDTPNQTPRTEGYWATDYFDNNLDDVYEGMSKSNDGVFFKNMSDGSVFVNVFNPNQIKLADGTNKTFNPDTNDIRFQLNNQQRTQVLSNLQQNLARVKQISPRPDQLYLKQKAKFDQIGVTLQDVHRVYLGLDPDKRVADYIREAEALNKRLTDSLTKAGFTPEQIEANVQVYWEYAKRVGKDRGVSAEQAFVDMIADFEFVNNNPSGNPMADAKASQRSVWQKLVDILPFTQGKMFRNKLAGKRTETPTTDLQEDKILENSAEGRAFLEQYGNQRRGARKLLDDGRYVIFITSDARVSTPVHELAHIHELYMSENDRNTVLSWTGQTTWDTTTSEMFARGFEQFLSGDLQTSNKKLQGAFNNFKQWLKDIYNGIMGVGDRIVNLSPEVANLYTKMFNSDIKVMTDYNTIKESVAQIYNVQPQSTKFKKATFDRIILNNFANPSLAYQSTEVQHIVKHAVEQGYNEPDKALNIATQALQRANEDRARGGVGDVVLPIAEAVGMADALFQLQTQIETVVADIDSLRSEGKDISDLSDHLENLRDDATTMSSVLSVYRSSAGLALGMGSKLFSAADFSPERMQVEINRVNKVRKERGMKPLSNIEMNKIYGMGKNLNILTKEMQRLAGRTQERAAERRKNKANASISSLTKNPVFKQIFDDLAGLTPQQLIAERDRLRKKAGKDSTILFDDDPLDAHFDMLRRIAIELKINPGIKTVTEIASRLGELENSIVESIMAIADHNAGEALNRVQNGSRFIKQESKLIGQLEKMINDTLKIQKPLKTAESTEQIQELTSLIEEIKKLVVHKGDLPDIAFAQAMTHLDNLKTMYSDLTLGGKKLGDITEADIAQMRDAMNAFMDARLEERKLNKDESPISRYERKLEEIQRDVKGINALWIKQEKPLRTTAEMRKLYKYLADKYNINGLDKDVFVDVEIQRIKNKIKKEQYDLKELLKQKENPLYKTVLREIFNTPRLLILAGDFSYIMYQGGLLTVKNFLTSPLQTMSNVYNTLRSSVSENFYNNITRNLESSSKYYEAQAYGLRIDSNEISSLEEELNIKTILERIPRVGKGFKKFREFSERGYLSYMNALRLQEYVRLTEGITDPDSLKVIVDHINTVTGAASFGKSVDKVLTGTADFLIAPRLYASVFKSIAEMTLLPGAVQIFRSKNEEVRQAHVRKMGNNIKILTGQALLLATAYAATSMFGEEGEDEAMLDLADSQFLKTKIGQNVISITPFATYVKFLGKLGSKTDEWLGGEGIIKTKEFKKKTLVDVVYADFLKYRINPFITTSQALIFNKDYRGMEIPEEDFWTQRIAGSISPIALTGALQNYKDYGLSSPLAYEFGLDMLGYNTYTVSPFNSVQVKNHLNKVDFNYRTDYPDDFPEGDVRRIQLKNEVQDMIGQEILRRREAGEPLPVKSELTRMKKVFTGEVTRRLREE